MLNCEYMTKRIYELGSSIGLDNKEIDRILNQPTKNEQPSFAAGPLIYGGGWYGTISIYVF